MWIAVLGASAALVGVALVVVWLVGARVLRAIQELPRAVTARMDDHTTKFEPLTCSAPGADRIPGRILACMLLPEACEREAARLERALDHFQQVEDCATEEELESLKSSVPSPFYPRFPEFKVLPSVLVQEGIDIVQGIRARYHRRERDDGEVQQGLADKGECLGQGKGGQEKRDGLPQKEGRGRAHRSQGSRDRPGAAGTPPVNLLEACKLLPDLLDSTQDELEKARAYYLQIEEDATSEQKAELRRPLQIPFPPDIVPPERLLPSSQLDLTLRLLKAIREKYHSPEAQRAS